MILRYPLTVLVYLIPAILFSLTFHELSHAFVSYKLGDPTAKQMGRLSLNPLEHLDILGTIMLLVSSFGWAKPVPINPMYYKNRRQGTMLVSIAGPLANLILATIFYVPKYYISRKYNVPITYELISSWDYRAVIFNLASVFVIINIGLAAFNLLPFPPLDGSKILGGFLSPKYYYKMLSYENYISIAFLLIIFIKPGILSFIMSPLTAAISAIAKAIAIPIAKLFL